ncbi:cytochrome P450 [Roridomyces roridus]|uniref:Cytochrome P450 n=1 Tax=Roridomyces roridus TaxID=1738132 RepID=A0AAD7FDP5_9AGAR|nr:cytochrome P450 [Roridomyces roridus]
MSTSLALSVALTLLPPLFFLAAFLRFRQRSSSLALPPGPRKFPFIGHLLRMPKEDSATIFHEWSKVHGDVLYLQVLGRNIIILDSYDAAVDLLERRGAIYSDRPKFTFYELLGFKPALTFLQYKDFGVQRQMHQTYLSRQKAEGFREVQTEEARILVRNLLECAPAEYEKQIARMATAIITHIISGHRITTADDKYLRLSHEIQRSLSSTGPPSNSPLDFFPWLQHFPPWLNLPGAAHLNVIKSLKATMRELYEMPLRVVKEQRAQGEAVPSFILEHLEQLEESAPGEYDELELKGAAATMFSAGQSTTWTSIMTFIIAMVLHPEFHAKAQREIDSVIGNSRLPDFEDRDKLPFVEGLIQETLRWNPPVPLNVPHRLVKDDIYRGMLIPKGSLVFANIRGMGLDEKIYSDPTTFNPERFLPEPAGQGEPFFDNTVFGFGRRICTGQYVGGTNLWIAIATIVACCDITNARDDAGRIIVPDHRLTDGLISHPRDMRCIISPRSVEMKELVVESCGHEN